MQLLDEAPVLDSEIDSLGHMNVRYYLTRVDRASRALLAAVGLASDSAAGAVIRRYDTYSRFHREQFAGATLSVAGGVLDIQADFARCFFEIRNPAREEIAATFITASTLIDTTSQRRLSFPAALAGVNEKYGVRLPDYGTPRSLSLDPPRTDVTLDMLSARVSEEPAAGMMSGRRETTVNAQDCDQNGRLREDVDLMFIMHRPQSGESTPSFGPPVMRTDNGHRFSWAMIETRALVLGRPRSGQRLVSIGADIAHGERWRQSRRWAFVVETGELVGVNDTVGIALDLDERRSIPIPGTIRETIERTWLPDLA
ncbi:MAG: thioesterase family protein [Pseudomonadales bacterium]|nr:thioesterase family protein [Pseudomonadales bacterium]